MLVLAVSPDAGRNPEIIALSIEVSSDDLGHPPSGTALVRALKSLTVTSTVPTTVDRCRKCGPNKQQQQQHQPRRP